jgi:DMSO/TMAO reductase YedYZ molybdopterin-dependent catalytic subunit
LVVVREEPLCAELRLERQHGVVTPTAAFYHRNNFPYPSDWPGLDVAGRAVSLADLAALPQRRLVVTLECAGNGHSFIARPAAGEPWRLGAVGTAEWHGVELRALLPEVPAGTVEVVFEAADGFARSLPVSRALDADTLLVTGMNGEPLPAEHGGPLRLIVAGWYGMAAVKWLTAIHPSAEPFRGRFQVEKYVIDGRPVQGIRVRAVIAEPAGGEQMAAGRPASIRGYAWAGSAAVAAVDVAIDGEWHAARPLGESRRYAWREWALDWTPAAGEHTLLPRATAADGEVQPLEPLWNELGYANNAAVPVLVEAR